MINFSESRSMLGRPLFLVAGLLIFLAVPADGLAGPKVPADKFMTEFGGQAVKVLGDPSLSETQRTDAVRGLLLANFDVDAIGKFVLSRHWRKATQAERSEFIELFEKYIVVTYGRRLGGYSGEKFVVERTIEGKDNRAIVVSRIERPTGAPVRVDWRVRGMDDGRWLITDVVIEGVSMAITQRNEFGAVIRNSGGKVEGLIAKLRELTAGVGKQSANNPIKNAAL